MPFFFFCSFFSLIFSLYDCFALSASCFYQFGRFFMQVCILYFWLLYFEPGHDTNCLCLISQWIQNESFFFFFFNLHNILQHIFFFYVLIIVGVFSVVFIVLILLQTKAQLFFCHPVSFHLHLITALNVSL